MGQSLFIVLFYINGSVRNALWVVPPAVRLLDEILLGKSKERSRYGYGLIKKIFNRSPKD